MIEADLHAFLLANATVAALIEDRLRPVVLPQGTKFPAVTYQVISATRPDRPTTGPPSVCQTRIQYDCWAHRAQGVDGYASVKAVADAIRQRLDGHSGSLGSGLSSVQHIRLENDRDTGYDDAGELYRVTVDATVWYAETSP